MGCREEGKNFCLKQVNPNNSELHFGIAFKYDPDSGGCYLCRDLGFGRKYAFEAQVGMPKEIKLKLKRRLRSWNQYEQKSI